MADFITTVEHVTPAWLTTVLHEAGVLRQGKVAVVRQRANDAFNSAIAHLELTYSSAVPESAPRRAVLKINTDHDGETEVAFYNLVALCAADLPMLVRCYAAAYHKENGASFCLLADLSDTHRPPVTREQILLGAGVPIDAHLNQIVDVLAQFHAYWWEHPRLGTVADITEVRPWFRDENYYRRHVQRRQTEWAGFIATVGEFFPGDLRALYERTLMALPSLWDRYLAHRVTRLRHITLTNGDCYLTQFLCPKDPASGSAYIIDFQAVSANFGAYDLAYLFPTFWTSVQRREQRREERLLRRYHQTLQAYGVNDYSWDDLLTDYQLMVTFMLFDPIWDQSSGAPQSYWWPKLQCLTGAFKDLNCSYLLDT